MRVQHNIAAMNAYRNFSTNNSKLNKNLEKLSTGYKINRAGDDAAGLAISEKMRAQISGIDGATKNSKDGISLIQTAEGALTEVHDMLNRMTTLAEQSANGTYDDEVDRAQLQKEVEALKSEIDRIADSTNYNGLKLLDGSLDSTTVTTDTTKWESIKTNQIAPEAPVGGTVHQGTITHKGEDVAAVSGSFTVNLNDLTPAFTLTQAKNNTRDTVSITIGDPNGLNTPSTAAGSHTNQTLTVTAADIYNAHEDGDDMTAATAKAFAYKYGGKAYEEAANAAGITQTTNTDEGITVMGDGTNTEDQKFSISLDGTNKLKFTQDMAPESSKGVVDTSMQVKVEMTNYVGKTTAKTGATNGQEWSMTDIKFSDAADKTFMVAMNNSDAGKAFAVKFVDQNGQSTPAADGAVSAAGTAGTAGVNDDNLTFTFDSFGANKQVQFKNSNGQWTDLATGDRVGFDGTATNNSENILLTATGMEFRIVDKSNRTDPDTANDAEDVELASFSLNFGAAANGGGIKTTSANVNVNQEYVLKAEDDATGSHKTYNFGTTETVTAQPREAASRASTYIKAADIKDKIKDGHQIEIGGEAYTFAVGAKSSVDTSGKNVIDMTSLATDESGMLDEHFDADVLNKAVKAISYAAKDNEMWTVGYDDSIGVNTPQEAILTLAENRDYSGDTKALTSLPGIASTIRFSEGATSVTSEATGKSLTLQIGDTSESFNKMSVNVTDMHAASLGIGDLDISTQDGASKALDSIKNAVNMVSDVRGSLGALQNRLDHTINNLGVMKENIQNAESLIRDTDVAEEMMTYTKNNILNQSAQAMLAQANQLPQGVLQLLG